jgi:hypothetical protein
MHPEAKRPHARRARQASILAAMFAWAGLLASCADDVGTTPPTLPGRPIYAVDDANRLIVFGRDKPGALIRSTAMTGVVPGETIVGLDFRPLDGRLYALSDSSRVYRVDTLTGAATAIGTMSFTPRLSGSRFGFDFNPVSDRIRVHSNSDQNLRLRPDSGTVANVDTTLAYAIGDPNFLTNPSVVGTAYTHSTSPPPAATELYAIDSGLDILVRIVSPDGGQLFTVGPLGTPTTEHVGFDIAADDSTAYATLSAGAAGGSRLYVISLHSGTATLIGSVGYGFPLRSIAVHP